MKSLNKYLIPELSNIVLDYYYFTLHNENMKQLNKEYHDRVTYTDWFKSFPLTLCTSLGKKKMYQFRVLERKYYIYVYNMHKNVVGNLPKNY